MAGVGFIREASLSCLKKWHARAKQTRLKQNKLLRDGNGYFFLSFYPDVSEYYSALYLSTLFQNSGVPCPRPALAVKKFNLIIFEYLQFPAVHKLPKKLLFRSLTAAVSVLQKIHSLKPEQKFLSLKPFGSDDVKKMISNVLSLARGFRITQPVRIGIHLELKKILNRLHDYEAKYFIHFDYQPRNLHWSGSKIFVTDFERARYGHCLWDIASLLYSPSIKLFEKDRNRFIQKYLRNKPFNHDDIEFFASLRLLRGIERRLASIQIYSKIDKSYFRHTLKTILEMALTVFRNCELHALADFTAKLLVTFRRN